MGMPKQDLLRENNRNDKKRFKLRKKSYTNWMFSNYVDYDMMDLKFTPIYFISSNSRLPLIYLLKSK